MRSIFKGSILSLTLLVAGGFAQAQGTLSLSNIVTSGTAPSGPVAAICPPGDSRVYIVEQHVSTTGRIRHVNAGVIQATTAPFFSISPVTTGSEQGLLGLAFHPNYATNRFFYVNYTDSAGNTVIARYTASPDGNSTVAGSAQTVLTIAQPFTNHNGGTLRFGPDGYLYVGTGDGGSSNDPGNRAQNLNELLGKFLRLDVNSDDFPLDALKNYHIPTDNPFVGVAGLDEIWSYGWRNPWKWSFDPRTNNGFDGLAVSDVGQGAWEENDYERPGDKGLNYGWRTYEGNTSTGLNAIVGPYVFPFYVYSHGAGISVTGGQVYRGVRLGPTWWGRYVFTDYSSGNIWTIPLSINGDTGVMTPGALITPLPALGFGTAAIEADRDGELLFTNNSSGTVRRLVGTAPWRSITGQVTFNAVAPGFRDANDNFLYSLNVGLSQNGTYKLPAPNGAFRVSVKHKNWLRKTVGVAAPSGDVSGINLQCDNGDIDEDNEITNADYSLWASQNGLVAGNPGFNPLADLDKDGAITNSDYSIWAGNNGLSGDN